jgi:hypothetical protein
VDGVVPWAIKTKTASDPPDNVPMAFNAANFRH